MYKLLIEDKNGVWKIVDLGDDKPRINYQANNIAELKDRQVNYSQALKLPPTKNNCALFGFSDSFDVVTDFPYKKHNCRLFSDDSVLAGTGSYLILDKVNKFFEVQILSGNADFFDILKNKEMSELDLGSIVRNLAAFNPANFGGKYEYAAATFTKVAETFFRTDIDDMYPFVLLKPAIESLISQNGYTLETNLTDAQWNKKAISLCSLKPIPESWIPFYGTAAYSSLAGTPTGYLRIPITGTGNGQMTQENPSGYATQALQYKAIENGTVRIVITVNRSTSFNPDFTTVNVTNMTTGEVLHNNQFISHNIDLTSTVEKDQIIRISINRFALDGGPLPSSSYNISVRCELNSESDVPLNGVIYPAPNIGFDTQFDFFKMFVQLFGLTVNIDNETKTVKAYTMKKLYDNKAIAKDWSAKLNDVENDTSFVINGYAQNNYISFVENTSDKVADRGNFIVANETLDKAKDLFSLKFEAGFDRKVNSWVVANIPLNEIAEDNLTATFTGGKPHIVELSANTIEFTVYGSMYYYHIATHAKAQTFVDSFYSDLQTILNDAKWKDEEFYLTDQDIEDFENFVPVYVQKYGAYFYVNKIKNFVSGVLTKCELVRL